MIKPVHLPDSSTKIAELQRKFDATYPHQFDTAAMKVNEQVYLATCCGEGPVVDWLCQFSSEYKFVALGMIIGFKDANEALAFKMRWL
jgi:hypothetical protein